MPLHQSYNQPYHERVLNLRPADLMGYWPLWENFGTVAQDASGLGRTGTYTGPTLANGNGGIGDGNSSPFFDGVNDYCNVYSAGLASALVASGAAGTIALWFKVSGSGVWTDGVLRDMCRFRVHSTNYIIPFKSSTNGFLSWQYVANGVDKRVDLGSQSMTGWTHLALTWDKPADQLKGYLNGSQISTTTTGLGTWSATATLTNQMTIGAGDTSGVTAPWSGWLAQLGLWSSALSAAEIRQLAVLP